MSGHKRQSKVKPPKTAEQLAEKLNKKLAQEAAGNLDQEPSSPFSHASSKTGVVSEVYPRFCNVILIPEAGSSEQKRLLCTYRRANVIDKEAEWRERSPVAVGDVVQVKVLGSKDGVIEDVGPRTNFISRRAPGKEGKVLHTIAANIDYVVIVTSLHDPDFSPGLVDRFLIASQSAGIAPVLVINKLDLRTNMADTPWQLYLDLGIRCYPLSSVTDEGVPELKALLKGKTSVFCGHSGVGKTSLLRHLFTEFVGRVGDISKSTGKGKHTTTVSTLIQTGDGTRFIDTPGIKEFGLFNVDPKELIQYFPEMYSLQVKREAYDHLPRYESYLRIKAALDDEGR